MSESPPPNNETGCRRQLDSEAPHFVPGQSWQQQQFWLDTASSPRLTFTNTGFQPSVYAQGGGEYISPWGVSVAPDAPPQDEGWPTRTTNGHAAPWSPSPVHIMFQTNSQLLDKANSIRSISQSLMQQIVLHCKDTVVADLRQLNDGWELELQACLSHSDSISHPEHNQESPYDHPLVQFFIPPPRLRWIHPSIVDAALYSFRSLKEPQGSFEFTTTGDSGFENAIKSYDWLAAIIGLLYYAIPSVRVLVLAHACDVAAAANCWICELSFVFRALDVGRHNGGQPVRLNQFAEAFSKTAAMTLGVDNDYEQTPLVRLDWQGPRIGVTLRKYVGGRKADTWIPPARESSNNLYRPMRGLSHHARISQLLRRREAERFSALLQRTTRYKLHFRCHQALNYILSALGKMSQEDTDIFQIPVKTSIACGSHVADETTEGTTVEMPIYVLDLLHTPWEMFHGDTPPLISAAASSAESLQNDQESRPSSSSSVGSTVVGTGLHNRLLDPATSTTSPPPISTRVQFSDLLRASLWKKSELRMICKQCGQLPHHRASLHNVLHQVLALPTVLAIKVDISDTHSAINSSKLRYWQSSGQAKEDEATYCRRVSTWLKLKSLSARRPKNSKHIKQQDEFKRLNLDFKRLVATDPPSLPDSFYAKQDPTVCSATENPWVIELNPPQVPSSSTIAPQSEFVAYKLIGLVVSVNYFWTRHRKNCLRKVISHTAKTLGFGKTPVINPADSEPHSAMFENLLQKIESEELMIETPPDEDQLIAFVRLPPTTDGPDNWILINGPIVTRATDFEVRQFYSEWKYPCAIFFANTSKLWSEKLIQEDGSSLSPSFSLGLSLFTERNASLASAKISSAPKFVPLSPEELRQLDRGGFVVAMDAEHVVSDIVGKCPAQGALGVHPILALGRLSLIRANGGPHDGTPFVDHYVKFTSEPKDYRTQFSGLYPGDLDPARSTRWLASYSSIFQMMRYLVQKGCRFIGHDLFNDFRVLGLIVPPGQIIDTVEIFRKSPSARYLSLRFLSHHVLHRTVQQDTHDSIEDAQAALALYRHYYEQVKNGTAEDFRTNQIEKLYQIGYFTNFKVGG